VNGARFRQSLDTTDWREALSREKELIAQAQEGKLAASAVTAVLFGNGLKLRGTDGYQNRALEP
jgi:hypothetical protein